MSFGPTYDYLIALDQQLENQTVSLVIEKRFIPITVRISQDLLYMDSQ